MVSLASLPKMALVVLSASIVLASAAFVPESEREVNRPGRIVHGEDAEFGSLTYQASIQMITSERYNTSFHFCGGTLISWGVVATAAHCMMTQTERNLVVVLGAYKLEDKTNPRFRVTKIYRRPEGYDDHVKIGDIALLQLDMSDASENRFANHPAEPVELAPQSYDPTGHDCLVSGWGHLKSKSSEVPEVLQKVSVKVVSQEGCFKMLGPSYPWDNAQDSMICAGGHDKDACQGDSGGPLVCDTGSKRYWVGIVSWGVGCAHEGTPGVYTHVQAFEPWIKKIIGQIDQDFARKHQGIQGN